MAQLSKDLERCLKICFEGVKVCGERAKQCITSGNKKMADCAVTPRAAWPHMAMPPLLFPHFRGRAPIAVLRARSPSGLSNRLQREAQGLRVLDEA